MLYRAGKGGIRTVAGDKVYHLGHGDTKKAEGERRDGVLVRPRHPTTGVAVCVSRAQLHGLRLGGGAQKRYEHFRRPLIRGRKWSSKENAKREYENATSTFAGLLREDENGRKKTQEKEHENATSISAGL